MNKSAQRIIGALLLAGIIGTIAYFVGQYTPFTEIFKNQVYKFLEQGAKTNAMAEQGVSYFEMRNQLVNTKASYDLLKTTWSDSLSKDMQVDFDKAIKAWDMTLDLWEMKINKSDKPTEPDINDWQNFVSNFKNIIIIKTYASSHIVKEYRGKKYLPFDDNISALLAAGGTFFNQGREKILKELR